MYRNLRNEGKDSTLNEDFVRALRVQNALSALFTIASRLRNLDASSVLLPSIKAHATRAIEAMESADPEERSRARREELRGSLLEAAQGLLTAIGDLEAYAEDKDLIRSITEQLGWPDA